MHDQCESAYLNNDQDIGLVPASQVPPYRYVRSDEAEAADAAGAAALAAKLGAEDDTPAAVPAMPVSPFAAAKQQQSGLARTLSGGRKGGKRDDTELETSLLDSGSANDITGTEAATARELGMMDRESSLESKDVAAADGHDKPGEDLKAKKGLPPLCGSA